ncbi:MAG: sensor histidine kinase [Spirochaetota bacterium]
MFDPKKRLPLPEVDRQAKRLLSSDWFSALLAEVPSIILILNSNRQIIFVNKDLPSELRMLPEEEVIGLRPGESFGCIRAVHGEHGCGSTKFCSVCRLADAIARSENGERVESECHLLVRNGESLNLGVKATPFELDGDRYVFCVIHDIGETKTKKVLERIFLHDMQNTVGTLYSIRDLIDELSHEELKEIVVEEAEVLMEELQSYRLMIHAESRELVVKPEPVEIGGLLRGIVESLKRMQDFKDQPVEVDVPEGLSLNTDRILLERILKNLIKNGFEAEKGRGKVRVKVYETDGAHFPGGGLRCTVSNPTVMPEADQINIFRKIPGNKGGGRGWGTYSVRLLTEAYLRGRVDFCSSEGEGTIFEVTVPSF